MMRYTVTRRQALVLLFLGAFLFLVLNVHVGYAEPHPAPRGAFEIAWYALADGGGKELTGGTYSLKGTVGQFDAGAQSGGSFTNNGGFWLRADFLGHGIYLPLTIR